MKFFWKLYFSIMMITMTCFSVGGYMLIQQGFQSSLKREVQNSYKNNDIMASILNELYFLDDYKKRGVSDVYGVVEDNLTDSENQSMYGEITNQTVQNNTNILFCIKNHDGKIIYMDGSFENQDELIKRLDSHKQGYKIIENKNHYYIHTIKPFYGDLYIETKSEITSLFENRNHQFQLLLYYSIALLLICAVLIYIITRWLVRPILRLSQATQEITVENHFDPIPVKGNDEISQLTNDFNIMSQRLLHSINELHENVNRQNLFVGNFAHELKTPLTSIIGYGDILRSKKINEEQMITYANYIVQEGKRLERLSMKLLELIVLKKNDFQFQNISAVSFLESIQNELTLSLEKENIKFISQYEDAMILVEPDLMKTVIINLVDNARKAIEKDGKIQMLGKQQDDDYCIQIIDNGCGIEKEEISKIMEAFYMVDKSRSRTQGGAGLGLAIVHEIIQLHHGHIHFESIPHQQTIVTVLIKGGNKHEI